jgi:hypothetical protein
MHKKTVWAVVRVWRGFPTEIKLFSMEDAANNYKEQLDENLSTEDDFPSCSS